MKTVLSGIMATGFLIVISGWAARAEGGETVEQLWKSKCAACHGVDGTASTPMGKKLKVRDVHSPEMQKMSKADLIATATKGKEKMPAYETKLTKEQIEQLVDHMRHLAKGK